jgi:hypothetical protein
MSLSSILLAIFLLCYGLLTVTNFRFDHSNVVLGLLAIGAGALMFARK